MTPSVTSTLPYSGARKAAMFVMGVGITVLAFWVPAAPNVPVP